MILVWGDRITYKKHGATSHNCPCCGEIVVGDVTTVKRNSHVFFITYNSVELSKYVNCRFCGFNSDFNPRSTPVVIDEGKIIATPEIINQTNPVLLNNDPIPLQMDLPKDVSRTDWAILSSINNSLESDKNNTNSEGNIEGVVILCAMAVLGCIMYVYLSFEGDKRTLPFIILAAAVCLLSFLAYKFFGYLKMRTTHKDMKKALTNYLRHTSQDVRKLSVVSEKLGDSYLGAKKYLDWSRNKI